MSNGERAEIKERAPLEAWWMLAILLSLYIFSFVDRFTINMLVPHIKNSLGLSDWQMGLVLGPAFSFFYAAFGLPLGWAADKFPRRWVIFIGTVLFGCATMSSALAQSFIALFIARACVAVGEASLSPSAYSLTSDKFPRHLITTVSAIYNTASKIGLAAAFAIGGLAIGLTASWHVVIPGFGPLEPWRMVLAVTGAPAILLGLLVFTFREPPRKTSKAENGGNSRSAVAYLISNWRLMGPILFAFALIGLCASSLNSWIPTYLTRHFGLDPTYFGPILSGISLAAALGFVVTGMVVDRLYVRGIKDIHMKFFTWMLLLSMPFGLSMFFMKNVAIFIMMYAIVAIVAMTMIIYVSATVQLIVPGQLKGRVISVFLLVVSVFGTGIGPMYVGFLTDYVFQDDMKIGLSLAVVMFTTLPLAFISLRLALKPLREAMDRTTAVAVAAAVR
jgi:MFS family permease